MVDTNFTKWTTIYESPSEEVRIIADSDGSLYWAYLDMGGSLEEIRWNHSNKVSVISKWLDDHHIDSKSFGRSANTPVWEDVFSQCKRRTVGTLVNKLQATEGIRI